MSLRTVYWSLCSVIFLTYVLSRPSKNPTLLKKSSYAGPYRLKVENVSLCSESSKSSTFIIELACIDRKSPSECRRANTSVTVDHDILQDMDGDFILNPWRDRQWKKDPIVMRFKKALRGFHDQLHSVYYPVFGDDTLPKKGRYSGEIPLTKITVSSIPVFPYGRYKGRMSAYDPPTVRAVCIDVIVDVIPV